ncbi:uncharacterized protein [Primulina eburnea]|uniref:uncharacterized protein n=1 Tax=Primulina eburnea TaxID=1245227 RepID=UPI003C6C535B
MTEEGPKIFTKKSKLKPVTPSTMAASSSTGTASVVPPPPPPKESFARRYKFMWPLLLAVNFVVGASLFTRTSKKGVGTEAEKPDAPVTSTSISPPAAPVIISENLVTRSTVEPVQRAPIAEDQQRELYKWLLEERRKIEPKDGEEEKRIEEEKAILKQFIRAKFIPSL